MFREIADAMTLLERLVTVAENTSTQLTEIIRSLHGIELMLANMIPGMLSPADSVRGE